MSIIAAIRQFFRLDKKTLSLENEFIYSVGLYIDEWKEFEKWEGMESSCFGLHFHTPNLKKETGQFIHHPTDNLHFQNIHFSHC